MPLLVAALVVLGLVVLLNLLLTVGILRRLRDTTTASGGTPFELQPGSTIGEFAVTATTGESITAETVTGTVAFFSANCAPCHDLLPAFVAYAREQGRDNVVAVLGGDDPATERQLAGVALVVTAAPDGGPIAAAFRNTWTPALYVVSDRRVVATASRVAGLPRRVASRS